MLSELRVAGFKSYGAEQRLVLAPLTVLIGANASGKSNLIEAMQLLAWLARSHRLGDLGHALREKELLVRGRVQDLAAERDVTLGCTVDDLELELVLRLGAGAARVVEEELRASESSSKLPYYRVERAAPEHGSELVVAYNNFAKGRNKPQITCVDQQAVFTQLLTPARFDATHVSSQAKIPAACEKVSRALGGMVFLDPQPRAMREYSYLDETTLYPNGSNVSAVLADLCLAQGRADEVLEFVRALPEQDIRLVEFLQGPRNDVMVVLVESFGGAERRVDATLLSDGTLRVLAVAAAVLSVAAGSVVVIEEIDNGVHPSRAGVLMDALHRAASARGVQLLVTTHNPALLDAVPAGAIGDTVACYRDPESGESRLQRLSELDDFVALTARGPLGMLATSGALDRFLKHRRTAEEREKQGQQVLQLFRSSR
ncbi:AAA family ATPase [Sandaracinus amylolyticus]|uniref:DNA recombination and repair protein RecF n=1 Tax=Sandaracinus amylolyticus TaxID=927083 RepID=A0A0F6W9P9_9BACT|nr:ATP-binding protein [Sandaracinus amylolyticus]AKF10973.1 DNA recombination and repair protein RecF [Sandaracinus amylolyticus]